jgi:hypothetical protein
MILGLIFNVNITVRLQNYCQKAGKSFSLLLGKKGPFHLSALLSGILTVAHLMRLKVTSSCTKI